MSFICEVCSTWYFNIENHCCVCLTSFENEDQYNLHCCGCTKIFESQRDFSNHICGLELEENQTEDARRVEQELINMIDLQLGIEQNVLDEMDNEQKNVPEVRNKRKKKVNKRYKEEATIPCCYRDCKELFSNHVELAVHQVNDHFQADDPSPEFSCWRVGCEESFYTHDQLELHLRNDHTLSCWRLECSRTFPNQEELDLHIRNDHFELHLVHEPAGEFSSSTTQEELSYHLHYEGQHEY